MMLLIRFVLVFDHICWNLKFQNVEVVAGGVSGSVCLCELCY